MALPTLFFEEEVETPNVPVKKDNNIVEEAVSSAQQPSPFLKNIKELGISAAQGIPNLASAPESIRKALFGSQEPTTTIGKAAQLISTPGKFVSDQLEKLRDDQYKDPQDYLSKVAHVTASNLPFLLFSGPLSGAKLGTDLFASGLGVGAKEAGLGVPGEIVGFFAGNRLAPKVVGKTAGLLEKGAEKLGSVVPSLQSFTQSFRDQLGKHGFKDLARIANLPPEKRQSTLNRLYENEPKYGSKISIEDLKPQLYEKFKEVTDKIDKPSRYTKRIVQEVEDAVSDLKSPRIKTASDLFNAKKSFGENYKTNISDLDKNLLDKVNNLYKDAFKTIGERGGQSSQWSKYVDTITELNKFKYWKEDLVNLLKTQKGLARASGYPLSAALLSYLGVPKSLLVAGAGAKIGYEGSKAFSNFIRNPEGQKILSELMVGAVKGSPSIVGKSLRDINKLAENEKFNPTIQLSKEIPTLFFKD